ncbi:CLUMA_CG002966, isoform A [Clunio marinus]|uniref:CLUMA_CG002966, isoform A n=1 Tax=Clunio marinus TaxID=568069 RepID=A0A1J1HMD5_9DIPT|nr:CLUMA_CG002966, isoform A [Clunio marinus]
MWGMEKKTTRREKKQTLYDEIIPTRLFLPLLSIQQFLLQGCFDRLPDCRCQFLKELKLN